ncbi:MAG TPA: acyloxyacyl hydrolase [Pyrinomonadaceae bacterium]|jgi:hypothetical protein
MLGILRLAAGSLFLILTVLFFTVAAQQKNDSLREVLPGESSLSESTRTMIEKESFIKKETSFFKPPENHSVFPESAETVEPEPQTTTERSVYRARRGAVEYNFEVGIAPFDPTHFTGEKTYNTTGRKLGTLNFRLGRVIGTPKSITVTYLFGFTPLVVARANEVRNPAYISPLATPGVPKTKRETSFGFGATPANFRFTFFPGSRVKPFAQVGAGVLYFNKPMPIPESRRLQFTGDFGGGFIVHLTNPKHFMIFGYKYFHISNGNIGGKKWNPGYNANVFYIGFSFFK